LNKTEGSLNRGLVLLTVRTVSGGTLDNEKLSSFEETREASLIFIQRVSEPTFLQLPLLFPYGFARRTVHVQESHTLCILEYAKTTRTAAAIYAALKNPASPPFFRLKSWR